MNITSVDKIEIRIEKQPKDGSCNWCIYCGVEKKNKSKLLFLIKSNQIPHLLFQKYKKNIVKNSNHVKLEILNRSPE